MKNIGIKFFLFVLMMVSLSCNSQSKINNESSQPDTKEIERLVNIFFEKYKTGGTKEAVDYIFSTTKSVSGLGNLENKLDSTRQESGKFIGFEQITQKNAANSLVFLSYLVKHENQPIRFSFSFYKPYDHWILLNFNFDTELISELQYSGKIYFIK
jgi:hypothetical protein